MVPGASSDISYAEPARCVADGVVPFAIAESDARERAAQSIRRAWLAPSKIARRVRRDALRRVYLPFWAFDAHAVGYWSAAGATRGIIEMDFCNLLVSAERRSDSTSSLPFEPLLSRAVHSYDAREVGTSTIAEAQRNEDEAILLAHARIERELAAVARRGRPAKERDKLQFSRVEYARESSKRLLLPLWLFEYRYLGGSHRIAINGADGRVVGAAPTSVVKVAFVGVAVLWFALFLEDAETALSIPLRMAEGVRWLVRRTISS